MTDNAESGGKKKGAPLDYLLQFESLRADRVAKLREIFDFVTQGSGVIKVRTKYLLVTGFEPFLPAIIITATDSDGTVN